MVGLVPLTVIFYLSVVDPPSPFLLVGMFVVADRLLLVVSQLPAMCCCQVLAPVLVCQVVIGCRFLVLLATLPLVLFVVPIALAVLVKTAPSPFLRCFVLHQLLVWDIIPSITLQKLASLACHSARHGNVLAVRHP